MAKTKKTKRCVWQQTHSKSGSTQFEATCNGAKLWARPDTWAKPHGPGVASITKGSFHKRFTRATLASAKAAAVAAAKSVKRAR